MVSKHLAQDCFSYILGKGADFCEFFIENNKKNILNLVNGKLEDSISGLDFGLGLRIVQNNKVIYVYSNDINQENVMEMAKKAVSVLEGKAGKKELEKFRQMRAEIISPIQIMPNDVAKSVKIDLLKEASQAAFQTNANVSETKCVYLHSIQNVCIINSEGLWVNDERVRTRLTVQAVASSMNEKQSAQRGPAASKGFEMLQNFDVKSLGQEVAESACRMLQANFCKGGEMPVVIGNGFGGVLFHEACGHSLEATSVAKGQSVFCDRLETLIASELVTAVDNGTIINSWGSLNIDDEGTKTKRNVLIEKGILKSYLVDKINGRKMNMESTGSGRRESYRYAPTSRMTNTYIENGEHSVEDIIAATEYGLYAKEMGGGSVEPSTGNFNFSVQEGYMIEKGKIKEAVRGATLIGKGEEILKKIDMVGNDLKRGHGLCGSVSGSIPTDVGQPTLRVSSITVGGRS